MPVTRRRFCFQGATGGPVWFEPGDDVPADVAAACDPRLFADPAADAGGDEELHDPADWGAEWEALKTSDQVLAWVHGGLTLAEVVDRARFASQRESAGGARKTLLDALAKLVPAKLVDPSGE